MTYRPWLRLGLVALTVCWLIVAVRLPQFGGVA